MNAKRSFQRDGAMLVDRILDEGIPVEIRLAESETVLEDLSRPSMGGLGVFPRRAAESGRSAVQVLADLQGYVSHAPLSAVTVLNDDRIRQALLANARIAPVESLASYAPALAVAGGLDAILILESRRREIENSVDPGANATRALAYFAGAELFIEPHRIEPALTLVRAMSDTTTPQGKAALFVAADLSAATNSRAEGLERLRACLDQIAMGCDDQELALLAPHLLGGAGKWHEIYQQRLGTIEASLRPRLLANLVGSGLAGIGIVVNWLPKEPDTRLALSTIRYLLPSILMPSFSTILAHAFSDASPSLRLMAVALSARMFAAASEPLLRAAIADEPDQFISTMIRLQLSAYSSTPLCK